MRAPLLVLTGPPAVGKSTAAEIVADRVEPSAVVAGDHFFDHLRRGRIEPWIAQSHQQNTELISITLSTAVAYTRAGWATVLEGIIGPWFLDALRRAATDAELHYAVLEAPLDVCLRRAATRGSALADDVIVKMHGEFDRAELVARHRVDSRRSPSEVAADLLVRIEAGTLRLEADRSTIP